MNPSCLGIFGFAVVAFIVIAVDVLSFLKKIFREGESKERVHKWERNRERESEAGSALSAQSPTRGSNSGTVTSQPELKSRVRHLTE